MNQPTEGYRLIERVGRGRFSEVWKAESPGGLFHAVKIMFPQRMAKTEIGADLWALIQAARLQHPCLVQVHSVFSAEDRVYIAMDLADGDLQRGTKKKRGVVSSSFSRDQILTWLETVATGLDALHKNGIVHRNVKPSKMLTHGDQVWLGGLGLMHGVIGKVTDTRPVGTPRYMAPECWHGAAIAESDQYALACSFLELSHGRDAFPQATLEAIARAHREEEPDLTGLPSVEQEVLRKALAKEPQRRFRSCMEFIQALRG